MRGGVLIVGGGVVGAATAYFLAARHGLGTVVIERDPTYRHASSALSASSIRQQFSTEINTTNVRPRTGSNILIVIILATNM